jgi:single-strand DNA-binding protein
MPGPASRQKRRSPASEAIDPVRRKRMSDHLTLTGLVATIPKHVVTGDGLSITNFRLASTQRKYDRSEQKWVDGETNWYTITAFRQLATNVVTSVQKGQRIVVTGRLRVRDWATDDKRGTNVEVDADAIGHDLGWGTAQFTRSASAKVAEADAEADAGEAGDAPADPQPEAPEPTVVGGALADATPF